MDSGTILNIQEVLSQIDKASNLAWVYLPKNQHWTLNSNCAILESEEVSPEHEDDPDAGVPEFAKRNDLVQVLPATVVQEIVANARAQKPNITPEELFEAFLFYYKRDAFIKLLR